MGKSLRSKRMRANRNRKRDINRPKELKKLKEALTFEYNEQTENAHISIFNDIVNGPLPNDGTYFEPSVTVLEKSQQRYESFLTRKIPKIAEIASKNLARPIGSPRREDDDDDHQETDPQRSKTNSKEPTEDIVLDKNECGPNKYGSWPKWMNHRKIRTAARIRRKIVKRYANREKRMNKSKTAHQRKSRRTNPSQDVEMATL